VIPTTELSAVIADIHTRYGALPDTECDVTVTLVLDGVMAMLLGAVAHTRSLTLAQMFDSVLASEHVTRQLVAVVDRAIAELVVVSAIGDAA
jgi:hypothetical protein